MPKVKYTFDQEVVYNRIKRAWENAKYKNANDFANALGVSKATVSKWKKTTTPDLSNMMEIANLCNCSLNYLVGQIATFEDENDSAYKATGLSETAIEMLRKLKERDEKCQSDYRNHIELAKKIGEGENIHWAYPDGVQYPISMDDLKRKPLLYTEFLSYLITSDRLTHLVNAIDDKVNDAEIKKRENPKYKAGNDSYDFKTWTINALLLGLITDFIEQTANDRIKSGK